MHTFFVIFLVEFYQTVFSAPKQYFTAISESARAVSRYIWFQVANFMLNAILGNKIYLAIARARFYLLPMDD